MTTLVPEESDWHKARVLVLVPRKVSQLGLAKLGNPEHGIGTSRPSQFFPRRVLEGAR